MGKCVLCSRHLEGQCSVHKRLSYEQFYLSAMATVRKSESDGVRPKSIFNNVSRLSPNPNDELKQRAEIAAKRQRSLIPLITIHD
jgi:hypothetical protein